jgi:23S rRNA (guanosine2251-2'-O)-methyltransferase
MTADVHLLCSVSTCGLRFPAPPNTRCPFCGGATEVAAPRCENQPVQAQPRRALALVLDNIRSAHNVGVMLRTAESLGVQHVYHCGITAPSDHPKVAKAALGSQLRLATSTHRDAAAIVAQLIAAGTTVWALESVAGADNIFAVTELAPRTGTLALVVGNEVAGVDPAVLALCQRCVALPMMGDKNSLNVGHAWAAAGYVLAFG